MRKQFTILLFSLLFIFSVSAQNKEARKIDEFGRIPCGDFRARIHVVFETFNSSPDSKIYVIYYGGRYRKIKMGENYETGSYKFTKLDYPHRDDGLNWAKSIPLFLTTYTRYPTTPQNLLKGRIILIDGGFRENDEAEIWLVQKDATMPKPTPTIDEKDIKFRKERANEITDFTKCYPD